MAADKTLLRRHFRKLRRDHVAALSAEARDAADRALAAVVAPLLPPGATVASYAAYGPEIDPRYIEALDRRFVFPRVVGNSLAFHHAARPDLRPGFADILEPVAGAHPATPAIVLVPLLAVTLAGVRLGQGAGYYDRALAALRSTGRIIAIGLTHEVQIAETLPEDPWDQPLDYVATPRRLVDCARNR